MYGHFFFNIIFVNSFVYVECNFVLHLCNFKLFDCRNHDNLTIEPCTEIYADLIHFC